MQDQEEETRREAFTDRYGSSHICLPASGNHFSANICVKCTEYRPFSYFRGVYLNHPGGTPCIRIDHACQFCYDDEEGGDKNQ